MNVCCNIYVEGHLDASTQLPMNSGNEKDGNIHDVEIFLVATCL